MCPDRRLHEPEAIAVEPLRSWCGTGPQASRHRGLFDHQFVHMRASMRRRRSVSSGHQSMIRKSGYRFSETLNQKLRSAMAIQPDPIAL
jgi:hypothetical protein